MISLISGHVLQVIGFCHCVFMLSLCFWTLLVVGSAILNSPRSFHAVPFLLAGNTRPQFVGVSLMVVVVDTWRHHWESVCLVSCSCEYTSWNGSFRSEVAKRCFFCLCCAAISMHGCSLQCLGFLQFPWQCSVFIDFVGGQHSFHVLHLWLFTIIDHFCTSVFVAW